MAVSDNYEIVVCKGDSSTTEFSFPFRCLDTEYLVVEYVDKDGVRKELAAGTEYTVQNGLDNTGGVVTYPIATGTVVLSADEALCIYRSTPQNQTHDFSAYKQAISDALDNIETTHDKEVMLVQEVGAKSELALEKASEASEKVDELDTKVDNLETSLKEDIAGLDTKIEAVDDKVDSLEEDLKKEIAEVDTKIEAVDGKVDNLEIDLKKEISEVDSKVEAVDDKVDILEEELEKDISDLDSKIDTVDDKVDTLEESLKKEIAEVDTKVEAVDDKVDTLEENVNKDISDLDTKVDDLETSVKSDLDQLDHRVDILEEKVDGLESSVTEINNNLDTTMLAIRPQTIVKGAVGELPDGWLEGWCDKPAEHLFCGNSPVKGYKGLLPYFSDATKAGWGTVEASAEYGTRHVWHIFTNSPTSLYWNSNAGTNHSLVYTGKFAEGMLDAYSLTSRKLDGYDISSAPKSWILTDLDDNVLDTQINITDWAQGETKVFTLATPIDTTTLKGIKLININNNGYAGGYTTIGNLSFLQSINNNAEITVKSGLQVAAGVEGKVLLSNELESETTLDISSANGSFYAYADISKSGGLNFGYTENEPIISHENRLYQDFVPSLSANADQGWVVSASSNYSSGYTPYYSYNDESSNLWLSGQVYSGNKGNEWTAISKEDGSKITTKGVILYPYVTSNTVYGAPVDFVIEGSNDSSTWETVLVVTNETSWTIDRAIQFKYNLCEYSSLRIRCTKNNRNNYFGFKRIVWLTDSQRDFYNTSTHTHYDKDDNILSRVYIGEFKVIDGVVSELVNYQHGVSSVLPVNNGQSIVKTSNYNSRAPYIGECKATPEIYHEGKWGKPRWARLGDYGTCGVRANVHQGKLEVHTPTYQLSGLYYYLGGDFNSGATSAISRVIVKREW